MATKKPPTDTPKTRKKTTDKASSEKKKLPIEKPKNVFYLVDKTGDPFMADPVRDLEVYLENIYAGKIKRPRMMILITDDPESNTQEYQLSGLDEDSAVAILQDLTFMMRMNTLVEDDD